jgi:hypothetical protein
MTARIGWVTNDPDIAAALTQADADYQAARSFASMLPLADKVLVLQSAKLARQAAYAEATS